MGLDVYKHHLLIHKKNYVSLSFYVSSGASNESTVLRALPAFLCVVADGCAFISSSK